jgi:hypothetical protein
MVLLSLGCLAVITLAQTAPPSLPPRSQPKILVGTRHLTAPEVRTFFIGAKEYRSFLAAPKGAATKWTPKSSLPIDLAQAEQIARTELAKLVIDPSTWQASDFQIKQFADQASWYMTVTLEPERQVVADQLPTTSFIVLIDFSGVPGRVSQVLR